jgi:hypothetical protein
MCPAQAHSVLVIIAATITAGLIGFALGWILGDKP